MVGENGLTSSGEVVNFGTDHLGCEGVSLPFPVAVLADTLFQFETHELIMVDNKNGAIDLYYFADSGGDWKPVKLLGD